MRCNVHRGEIEPGTIVWYEITGWEKERKQGGTNAVFDRRRTGTVMCETCRLRMKWGGSTEQEGLFDQGS